MSNPVTRLEILVSESLEMFTGLSATDAPSQFPPLTLENLAPALYVRTSRGTTDIHLVVGETTVLDGAALDDAHRRMAEFLRDLATDPEIWGYSAIVPFRWPGGLLHGEPAQEGLLIKAADRADRRGLALFHRWILDGDRVDSLEKPLFVKQSSSWFAPASDE